MRLKIGTYVITNGLILKVISIDKAHKKSNGLKYGEYSIEKYNFLECVKDNNKYEEKDVIGEIFCDEEYMSEKYDKVNLTEKDIVLEVL